MTGNILYYCLGGGLGHLSRTIAILNSSPKIIEHVRILSSSKLSHLASKVSPCPLDTIPEAVMNDKTLYFKFLQNFIKVHSIKVIILDTFPFGMFGEMNYIDEQIPRILIARYLNWDKYKQRINEIHNIFPGKSLVLEPQGNEYFNILKEKSEIEYLNKPVILRDVREIEFRDKFLIIHSGPDDEMERLIKKAKLRMAEYGIAEDNYDIIKPSNDIFPAYSIIHSYKYIVSAAGYNMCGIAAELREKSEIFLHPFKRKFDDQFLRIKNFENGMWSNIDYNGEEHAGQWLDTILSSFL
jgi:hypothetical protein